MTTTYDEPESVERTPPPNSDELAIVDGKASVIEAIAAIMGELPGIPKGNEYKSNQATYSYRGIEAVTQEVQPLLAKHGVVIVPKAHIISTVPSAGMKEGWQDTTLEVEWTVCGPDGSKVYAVTNGIGRDNSDKGSNKAATQAFKYLLLHLFCIADAKDDTDAHGSYEEGRAEPEPPAELADIEDRRAVYARIQALPDELKGEDDPKGLPKVWIEAGLPKSSELTVRSIVKAQALLDGFEAKARKLAGAQAPVADTPVSGDVEADQAQEEQEEAPAAGDEEQPDATPEGEAAAPEQWTELPPWPADENEQRQAVAAYIRGVMVAVPADVALRWTGVVKSMPWRTVDAHLREVSVDPEGLHIDSRRMLLTAYLCTHPGALGEEEDL